MFSGKYLVLMKQLPVIYTDIQICSIDDSMNSLAKGCHS